MNINVYPAYNYRTNTFYIKKRVIVSSSVQVRPAPPYPYFNPSCPPPPISYPNFNPSYPPPIPRFNPSYPPPQLPHFNPFLPPPTIQSGPPTEDRKRLGGGLRDNTAYYAGIKDRHVIRPEPGKFPRAQPLAQKTQSQVMNNVSVATSVANLSSSSEWLDKLGGGMSANINKKARQIHHPSWFGKPQNIALRPPVGGKPLFEATFDLTKDDPDACSVCDDDFNWPDENHECKRTRQKDPNKLNSVNRNKDLTDQTVMKRQEDDGGEDVIEDKAKRKKLTIKYPIKECATIIDLLGSYDEDYVNDSKKRKKLDPEKSKRKEKKKEKKQNVASRQTSKRKSAKHAFDVVVEYDQY